jgi:hypothetical protein
MFGSFYDSDLVPQLVLWLRDTLIALGYWTFYSIYMDNKNNKPWESRELGACTPWFEHFFLPVDRTIFLMHMLETEI